MEWAYILQPIVEFVIAAILAVITYYFKEWVNTKKAEAELRNTVEENEFITRVVDGFVRAAEQTFERANGSQKKSYVFDQVEGFLGQKGISVTTEQLDAEIEASVNRIKEQSSNLELTLAGTKEEDANPEVFPIDPDFIHPDKDDENIYY